MCYIPMKLVIEDFSVITKKGFETRANADFHLHFHIVCNAQAWHALSSSLWDLQP